MLFKKTLEALLITGLIAGINFKGFSQNQDLTKIGQNLIGSQIIENEPPAKENYTREETDNIKNKYENIINNIFKTLKEKGFSSLEDNQKIENLWNISGEIVWNEFTYKPQTWLIDGIKTEFIDCDLSAYVAGDIMNNFNVDSKIIYIPQHAILQTKLSENESIYIETTTNNTTYKSREEYQKKYPITCGEIDFKEVPNYLNHETNWTNFMKEGKYENALNEVNAKISINPGFFGYIDRAITNTFLEKYTSAIEDLALAQKMDPKSFFIHLIKGKINCHFNYPEKARENYTELLDIYKKLMETFEKEIEKTKSNKSIAEIYSVKALTNLSLADLIKSTESQSPFSKDCREIFSEVIYGQNRNQNPFPEKKFLGVAEADFNEASKFNPNNPNFYLGKAITTIKLGDSNKIFDFEKAREYLEKACSSVDSLEPKKAWRYYLGKARINLFLGNSKEAIEDLDKAILRIDDQNNASGLFYQKAQIEHKINDFEKALLDYSKALETYKSSSINSFSYWDLYNFSISVPDEIGKELCHCFPKSLIDNPWVFLPNDQLEIIKSRGKCYYALKNYKKALNDFNQILPSKEAQIYYLMSESKRYLKDYKGAIEDLNYIFGNFYSKDHPQKDYELFFRRGTLYEELNSYKEAIEDYNQSIKQVIAEEDFQGKLSLTQSIYNRAYLKKKIGDKKGSKKDLRILKELQDGIMQKKDFKKLDKKLF